MRNIVVLALMLPALPINVSPREKNNSSEADRAAGIVDNYRSLGFNVSIRFGTDIC